ncbi:adenosylcobinamide kinase/adenosylcobinamide-phosphate guanylyltransferase [Symbiobacterium terraclitae]|jgi:adenosylcobinamide kinase/adenosylcobinamide-phosphate guanylyltransferase|uniref:Adenosylcobinamide kinase n=1 Tax=Symbiobacterium terraclitae TaxID=557451 RepID=A0ABS4JSC0_9FIRM|nr:bifunctional adenosylcobinamide kinase/adenosylcobinamide-phosphate guanylyltransferase [Symbiobacterium terraclitae]MBP2018432.1 adenosylcobinamide kinase/adenosylcobinamide-phosphate guanylyltransferase [Symbiobacterium terraclitae]
MAGLILVMGGARSGKSRWAERLASAHRRVVYLATAQPGDAEMAQRIARHRADRPAHWRTVEELFSPGAALAPALDAEPADAVLLDCVTMLLSNHLLQAEEGFEERARRELTQLLRLAQERGLVLIAVTNEVGAGVVPEHRLGRLFRDAQGRLNQWLAREAEQVWACIAGIAVDLRQIGAVIP